MDKVTIAELRGRGRRRWSGTFLSLRYEIRRSRDISVEPNGGSTRHPSGGGGTQRIPRLIGIGRAMEVVLGADDVDAGFAERWF